LWVNWYSDRYDMVQVPVLPLATPIRMLTHGIYCDEFCENQMRDMPARQFFGSYIPSCGVGTGYARAALERLAETENNRIFEPSSLTEDYENGIRLHALGASQIFLPLRHRNGSWIATREYFPQTFRGAVKQRTRWIMGISLQAWQNHHWKGGLIQKYWFWRDRKGLIGNPVSLLTNLICVYAAATWVAAKLFGTTWGLTGIAQSPHFLWVYPATLAIGLLRVAVRCVCVSRVYGWLFGAAVPVRLMYANCINSAATLSAVYRYMKATLRNEPLVWLKTDHAYPTQAALTQHKRRLGEVLVGSEYVTEADLERALATQPAGVPIGQHLVSLGCIAENDLYEALSLQQSIPMGRVYLSQVKQTVARALPAKVAKQWNLLPFRIEPGNMFVAGTELPTEAMNTDLKRFTNLDIQFQLITPDNYRELTQNLL
jgi:adsorption protein B